MKVLNFAEQSSHTVIVSKELFAETCALAGKDEAAVAVEDYFKVRARSFISFSDRTDGD